MIDNNRNFLKGKKEAQIRTVGGIGAQPFKTNCMRIR